MGSLFDPPVVGHDRQLVVILGLGLLDLDAQPAASAFGHSEIAQCGQGSLEKGCVRSPSGAQDFGQGSVQDLAGDLCELGVRLPIQLGDSAIRQGLIQAEYRRFPRSWLGPHDLDVFGFWASRTSRARVAGMTWNAGLEGDLPDLQGMAFAFGEGDPTVGVGPDGSYFLESSAFNSLHDVVAVKTDAERRVRLMNGALRAFDANAGVVRLSGRFWNSDTPHLVVVPLTAEVRAKATLTAVAVATLDGRPVDPGLPPARGYLALADSDANVADVLRLTAAGDLDWVDLYKVTEIILFDMSGNGAARNSSSVVGRLRPN